MMISDRLFALNHHANIHARGEKKNFSEFFA